MAPSCTKSTKLIEFQFKFLHRRKENENCTFCHSASETLIQLFWSCHATSSFWERMVDWLQENLLISSEYILLNITALGLRPDPHPKHALQLNYIYLLARYHIWKAKLEETSPNFLHFLRLVKSRCTIETTAGTTKKWTALADCL